MVAALPEGLSSSSIMKISVDRYHAMIEAGILVPEDRVELLEGLLVTKMPKLPLHSYSTGAAQYQLMVVLREGWWVRSQEPVTLFDSEPEPDVAVVRGSMRDYTLRHPTIGEIGLVVEVADSSLERDRKVKKLIYARAEIPWYWLVDLINKRVELYSQPQDGNYRQCSVHGASERIPIILDGLIAGELSVADLLPPQDALGV
jgi:Uma2 family endonuclease